MRIVSDVASGSVAAISTVYMALENSSKILAKNIGENTVEVVKHKYGQEVGQVTDNALSAAGNAYLAVYNAGALAPKGLAKRLAKDTGKVAVGVPDEVLQGNINLEEPQPGPVNPDPQLQSFDYESGIEQNGSAGQQGSTSDPTTKKNGIYPATLINLVFQSFSPQDSNKYPRKSSSLFIMVIDIHTPNILQISK